MGGHIEGCCSRGGRRHHLYFSTEDRAGVCGSQLGPGLLSQLSALSLGSFLEAPEECGDQMRRDT